MQKKDHIVILFYKFTHIADPKALADAHLQKAQELGLLGRMLVAEEGVNGTFEGSRESIDAYKDFVWSDSQFAGLTIKESAGNGKAFPRLSIKVRDEVVTLGAGAFDPSIETATELPAEELQKWYETGEDFVVLDLRNDYEIASGKFERTIDPGLSNFRDLPEKLNAIKNLKDKKVVAVCTGGVRCEKATCLLRREGFSNIYQLKDGIHTYMQKFPGEHFKGTLFVFDNRLTTDVTPSENKIVIGQCAFCSASTENYCSDDSVRPSRKLLCCDQCYKHEGARLRQNALT